MDKILKILVVDDHPAFLKGMSESIESLPFVGQVGSCLNYKELKIKLAQFIPDVVFLDLNLPDSNGFIICEELRRLYKHTIVAIVTSYDISQFTERARRSGASAYFLKSTDIELYGDFLHDVQAGRIDEYRVYAPSFSGKRQLAVKDGFELKASLTKRERGVMKMIVQGFSHREIESSLNISYETFRGHHHSILNKLELKNDVELVHFADKYLLEVDY